MTSRYKTVQLTTDHLDEFIRDMEGHHLLVKDVNGIVSVGAISEHLFSWFILNIDKRAKKNEFEEMGRELLSDGIKGYTFVPEKKEYNPLDCQ